MVYTKYWCLLQPDWYLLQPDWYLLHCNLIGGIQRNLSYDIGLAGEQAQQGQDIPNHQVAPSRKEPLKISGQDFLRNCMHRVVATLFWRQ
jgi:hypothetical protein